jgi:phenylpropionate dioxygenase-like ring-hydroxylating dioxygenase large terminal subunit
MTRTFLRDGWYVAAFSDEISRAPLPRLLVGEPVVMYRKADGAAVALEDRCCHRRAPLSKGKVVGDALQCGYHGFTFDASGACIAIPGQERVPASVAVRSYPLVERHGFLWIWMGDQAKADPALIPDFKENTDPGWYPTRAMLPLRAHYQLVVENLLDLSHVAFVHGETIGADDDTRATLDFDRGPRHVRLTRTAPDITTAAFYRIQGLGPRADQVKTVTFIPPCHVSILVATTERAVEKAEPLRCRIMIHHACVPETEHSMHYFISSARDFQSGPDAAAKSHQTLMKVFDEDRDIIEAQQRCIELEPEAPVVNVHGDWGSVQMRRMVAELLANENAAMAAAR